ncbi:MAG: hypothetical protein PHX47_02510 [Candidatus ainarchaeum sp.]|jgi:hypothetical protein|nr:hypothetical protein [Candidatus ainarchaeum sp.]
MVNWDSLIGILIVVVIILVVWAKVSRQTVGEVIGDIKDMIIDKKEDTEEYMDITE